MKLRVFIILLVLIPGYFAPKYELWLANITREVETARAKQIYEIEKLKTETEAERVRGLEEAIKAKEMVEALFPGYMCFGANK